MHPIQSQACTPKKTRMQWGDTKPQEALAAALDQSSKIGMPLTLYTDAESSGWNVLNPISQDRKMRQAAQVWLTVLPQQWWN